MKARTLLLSAACVAALAMNAQDKHNFSFIVSENLPNADSDTKTEKLMVWFDTDFAYGNKTPEGDFVSSIYTSDGVDMISSSTKVDENSDVLHGMILDFVYENDLICVTVPDGQPAGTVLFHLNLGSKPNRVNDTDNNWGAYMDDCNGMYVGVKAPAGATVNGYLCTPGYDAQDGYGKIAHATYFDFGTLAGANYTELTSGAPYNDDIILKNCGDKWPRGYCCKYVDVAVKNVKGGDRVALRGIQTLHPGITPEVMLSGSSSAINTVIMDENAPVEYFNLQGVRVAEPAAGLYIRRQGDNVAKVMVK